MEPVLIVVLAGTTAIALYRLRSYGGIVRHFKEMAEKAESEKDALQTMVRSLEEEVKAAQQKGERLAEEYDAKLKSFAEKERKLLEDSEKLEDGLSKIHTLKETIELHRTRVGTLEREKIALQKKFDEEIARMREKLKELEATPASEIQKEKERLDAALKKREKELEAVQKEALSAKETLAALKEENEKLKREASQYREELKRYGLE
jgi:chromosome segregation ATPase